MKDKEESCNARHFSRLMKSCFPTPTDSITPKPQSTQIQIPTSSPLSSLPDDLLIEIFSRLPLPSLPSLSSVCRRFLHLLLHSPSLPRLRHLTPTLFAFSFTSFATLSPTTTTWTLLHHHQHLLISPSSHSRIIPIGRKIHLISRSSSAVFDPWTHHLLPLPNPLFPRKRFAAAPLSEKIYVSGGSATSSAVEEFDTLTSTWRVVSNAPRRRYGCLGVGVDGVFYIIGGLKLGGGGASGSRAIAGVYASSMDLYDVEARGWLRSRAVPGGGCVVAACGAAGHVFILASHAVELSFWRFNAKRGGGNGGGGGFGEWCRMRGPPLPAQVRLDGTVRFTCVGVEDKVVMIQVIGSINDLVRRSGRSVRGEGCKEGLVLIFDCVTEEWSRGPDLPQSIQRGACVCVHC